MNQLQRLLGIARIYAPWHPRYRYRLLGRLAEDFGIDGFMVEGKYGRILGSPRDEALLKHYARTRIWAPHTTRIAADALRGGGTYLDIGANIGITTLPLLGLPIAAHAFEPEPGNLRFLRANLAGHDNVTVHPVALFDADTTVAFEISVGNLGDHRIHVSHRAGRQGEHRRRVIEVPARRLDDVLPDLAGTVVAKIDTQGAEPFVIAGGRDTLARAEIVFLEYWPYGMARMGGDIAIVHDFIRTFRTVELSSDFDDAVEPVSMEALFERMRALDPAKPSRQMDLTLYR